MELELSTDMADCKAQAVSFTGTSNIILTFAERRPSLAPSDMSFDSTQTCSPP